MQYSTYPQNYYSHELGLASARLLRALREIGSSVYSASTFSYACETSFRNLLNKANYDF